MVHLPVAASREIVGSFGTVLRESRAGAFLRGVRITQFGVILIQLQGLDGRCIVIHAPETRSGATSLVRAGLISTALG